MKNDLLSNSDYQHVIEILTNKLNVTESQLTPDARLREDLGADSLDEVDIVMALEERFELTIPDDVGGRIATVEDVLETVADLLERRSGETVPGEIPRGA
jgi:acyl carrier protein